MAGGRNHGDSLFGADERIGGGTMVIYLSGLQSVPNNLKEAVAIDGGGAWAKFRAVTVPYLSPIIFFNTLMSIIGSLQVFTQAMLMTGEALTAEACSTLIICT